MENPRINLDLPLEIKELTDEGTFVGFASVYGVVDLGGDVVEKGAFSRTIKSRPEVKILWRHDAPIGKGTIEDTEKGLKISGRLTLAVAQAKEALALMKDGVVSGLSIGFTTVKDEIKDGIRHLREVKLWEVSLTPFPMNEKAVVTAVKQKTPKDQKDFDEELNRILTMEGHYMRMQALSSALYRCMYMDGDSSAKTDEAATAIDQFKSSYTEWFPQYIAMYDAMYKQAKDFKEGRVMSAATREKIESAIADHRSALEKLQALLDESNSEKERPNPEPAAPSSDPVSDHSKLSDTVNSLMEKMEWNSPISRNS